MTVVGTVFYGLLRGADLGSLLPWVDFVLHILMPCVLLVDWFLWPPRFPLRASALWLCQIFPALYLAYVLIRGAVVDWYPYPFLNPARVGGYGGVALYSLGIAALFVVGGWLLFKLGNWRRDRLAARPQQV